MNKNYFFCLLLGIIINSVILQSCTQTDQIDSNEILSKVQMAYNNHDANAVAQLYAEDAVCIDSGEPEPLHGRKAIQESYASFFRAFPDVTVEFINVFTSGDQFCAEYTTSGTNTGPMASPEGDIQPTGRSVKIKGAFFVKVNAEGLVEEDRTYYDTASFIDQLGLRK
ncbi:SgcJ/EcaC family oxidoreductase [candidate division KSB1 bacterium]|nr:SgcJ/EcaC family oxidoreductase [candidate division KSB1 bacterium]